MAGKRRYSSKGRGARGFTLIEITICSVIVAVGFSAFLGVALMSVRDFEFFKTLNKISEWNMQIVDNIRDGTLAAKQYFDNFGVDPESQAYFDALELPPSAQPIDTTRLPVIDPNGIFEADTAGAAKTGNSLFFVKTLTPFVAKVQVGDDPDVNPDDSTTYRIPVYEFVLYYLTQRANEPIGRSPDSLELIRWSSMTVADYAMVLGVDEEVADADSGTLYYPRNQVVAEFASTYDSTYAWDSGKTVNDAFYYCYTDGAIAAFPETNMTLPMGGFEGLFSRNVGAGTEIKRASIAKNKGSTGFETGLTVPLYGVEETNGDGFPHGFEVQLIGPSSARQLMVRLVLCKEGSNRLIARENKAILTTRDF